MSTQSYPIYTRTLVLTGAVTKQRFVSVAGVLAALGAMALGVTRLTGVAGDAAPVDVLGTTTVEAGGAIAAGGEIQVGANGKAVARAGGILVAVALEAASADGDLIEVMLIPAIAQSRSVTKIAAAAAVTVARFVDADGDHATAAGNTMGAALNTAALAGDLFVQCGGVITVEAAEAIAVKGLIEVGANGKAAAKAAGVTVARAIDAAAADGDLIRAVYIPN